MYFQRGSKWALYHTWLIRHASQGWISKPSLIFLLLVSWVHVGVFFASVWKEWQFISTKLKIRPACSVQLFLLSLPCSSDLAFMFSNSNMVLQLNELWRWTSCFFFRIPGLHGMHLSQLIYNCPSVHCNELWNCHTTLDVEGISAHYHQQFFGSQVDKVCRCSVVSFLN